MRHSFVFSSRFPAGGVILSRREETLRRQTPDRIMYGSRYARGLSFYKIARVAEQLRPGQTARNLNVAITHFRAVPRTKHDNVSMAPSEWKHRLANETWSFTASIVIAVNGFRYADTTTDGKYHGERNILLVVFVSSLVFRHFPFSQRLSGSNY